MKKEKAAFNKEWLRNLLRKKETLKYALTGVLVGILLIFAGNLYPYQSGKTKQKETASDESSQNASLENRMAETFSSIEGAGKVKVMITYFSSSEKVIADETNERQSQESEEAKTASEYSKEVKKVTLNSTDGSEPLVVKELSPKIEGIVIIAQGGSDAQVKEALMKAASALTDVPEYKIEVLKMGG